MCTRDIPHLSAYAYMYPNSFKHTQNDMRDFEENNSTPIPPLTVFLSTYPEMNARLAVTATIGAYTSAVV